MSGESLGAEIVGPKAPQFVYTFIAQSRPPDLLRTQWLHDSISFYDLCCVPGDGLLSKGSRSGVWTKCVLGGLGYQGEKKHVFSENVWLFGLGTPGLQKNTWPTKKPLRDPFDTIPPLGEALRAVFIAPGALCRPFLSKVSQVSLAANVWYVEV